MLLFAPTHAEILVNAADNKQRDANMDKMEIEINREEGYISVLNNGRSVPVEMHEKEKVRTLAETPRLSPRRAHARACVGAPA